MSVRMETERVEQKLKTLVMKAFDSEAEVVYFLVEVRKFLELNSIAKGEFQSLNLFCDWCSTRNYREKGHLH
jgi:hypothetical protein